MSTQHSATPALPAALEERIEALPPILSVLQLAVFFGKKVGTVRKQIERRVEVPPVFSLPRGDVHATSFSFC